MHVLFINNQGCIFYISIRLYVINIDGNKQVSHFFSPTLICWSQASERRIAEGGLFSAKRIRTLPFNGYGEQVADLYRGLDLNKNF